MDQDDFIATFRQCFDYPDISRLTTEQISQLENRLTTMQWSSKQVLDDFEALYSDLSQQQRSHIKDVRPPLIELRQRERNQRKNIRQALDASLDDSLNPISFTVNEFINVCLTQINHSTRVQLKDQLESALGELKQQMYRGSFDADTFRDPYQTGTKDTLEEEFLQLYEYLVQRGWHRRDLYNLNHTIGYFYEDFDDVFSWIADFANQERAERTYVFFVSGLQVLDPVYRDDFVYAIVPPGELEVDDLIDIYPYDDIDDLDLYDRTSPGDELTVAKMLEEKTLIAFPIHAFGTYDGRDRALERLSEILDLFSYSHTLSQVEEPHFNEKAKYLVWRDNGESHCAPSSVSEHGSTATIFEWDIDRIFDILVPASQHESPLSIKLKRGLHFFRKGNNSRRDIDTIIFYIACLETIVGVGHVYRDEAIEKGLLLGKVRDSDLETFREALQRIYELRNEALHAGLRQVDTRGEVDVMRGVLKTALQEIAEAINEDGVTSMSALLTYFRAKKQAAYEGWIDKLESDGFEVDTVYSFTGTMYNGEGALKGDVSGNIEFAEDGQFITPILTVSNLDKEEDFKFGEGLEIEALVDDRNLRIERIREDSLIVMSINIGSFQETDPWETVFRNYEIE
ncbi:HEPN domain-containing protein [Haloprofundus halophilus]|uniref:HEPN domain-containing protein n=1 Tax=Haloprofundus halophilus TaxID=2283527 RepID=UPI000E435960|nr:HEPN domain-containing protein [Haloprofundus halophilus]